MRLSRHTNFSIFMGRACICGFLASGLSPPLLGGVAQLFFPAAPLMGGPLAIPRLLSFFLGVLQLSDLPMANIIRSQVLLIFPSFQACVFLHPFSLSSSRFRSLGSLIAFLSVLLPVLCLFFFMASSVGRTSSVTWRRPPSSQLFQFRRSGQA